MGGEWVHHRQVELQGIFVLLLSEVEPRQQCCFSHLLRGVPNEIVPLNLFSHSL